MEKRSYVAPFRHLLQHGLPKSGDEAVVASGVVEISVNQPAVIANVGITILST